MLCNRLRARECGPEPPELFRRSTLVEDHHIERLNKSLTLKGHTGCVNTLRWNRSGTILLSGSDDRTVRVWGIDGVNKQVLETGHTQNIFAVDFVPCGGERLVISAAGDHSIRLRDLNTREAEEETVWWCNGRVKRLASSYDEPHLCFSASEDGWIRQVDVRMDEPMDLIKAPRPASECKSLAISPVDPFRMAVALNDAPVPIYDRRHPKEPLLTLLPGHVSLGGHFSRRFSGLSGSVTHVAFSQDGTEVIVNLGSDQIYVFSLFDRAPCVVDELRKVLAMPRDEPPPFTVSNVFSKERDKAKHLFQNAQNSAAIDIYSQCLTDKCLLPCDRSMLLSNRAAALLARQWSGDAYACVRDSVEACLLSENSNPKALFRLARALVAVNQQTIASDVCAIIDARFPGDNVTSRRVREAIAKNEADEKEWKTSPLIRDYSQRFCGHSNTRTDIKESNFFGGRDQWVVAGSDCGSLLIWERSSGTLKAAFKADEHILNIVQPHPSLPLLATSGIEDVIRFWQPAEEEEERERERDDDDEEGRRYPEPWQEMDRRHDEDDELVLMMGNRILHRHDIPQCAQS